MENREKTQFTQLSIETLLDNSTSDFDLYIEIDGKLVLYAGAPYRWNRDELTRLLGAGHRQLFYSNADQAKVEVYSQLSKIPKIDMSLPPFRRVMMITDAAAELTRVLYDYPLTEASLAKGNDIARDLVLTIKEDKASVKALGKLATHDLYTYYHSARVAAYALAIALKMSMHDEEHLQAIAIGCLFHDIGKSKINLTILNKHGPLTNDEWTIMRQHPVFGHSAAKKTQLTTIPLEIIVHHHERLDGAGYPHNLSAIDLLPEVRIANFADIFDALTTNRPYQISRTRFEALDLIRNKMLNHLDVDVYKAMVDILATVDDKKES